METNETMINNDVPNQVPEANPVPQKKGKGAWKAVVAVVLTAGVVGSTTLSAFNLATLKSYIATQNGDQNEETTEDYVTIIVTTKKKQNVCFDRYVPVQGSIGDADAEYKLEIAMVSDAMQPDDILHNYTGILSVK